MSLDVKFWLTVTAIFWLVVVLWIKGTNPLSSTFTQWLWSFVRRLLLILSGAAIYLALTGFTAPKSSLQKRDEHYR